MSGESGFSVFLQAELFTYASASFTRELKTKGITNTWSHCTRGFGGDGGWKWLLSDEKPNETQVVNRYSIFPFLAYTVLIEFYF